MLNTPEISVRQFIVFVFIYTIGSTILIIPSALAAQAKQDAWITAVAGLVFGSLIIMIYIRLASRFPDLTLVELCEQLLGKWLGKLISLLFIGHFMLVSALVLRNMGDFMVTQIMPETPIQVIHILFIGVSVMAVRLGLEVLMRATEVFLPWILMLLFILICFVVPQIETENIQPIFENGLKPILSGTILILSTPFLEFILFLMIMPYLNEKKKAGKALLTGAILGGLVLILITALTIFVLGTDFAERNSYPTYLLGKKISIGNFIQRVEVIVAIIWFLTIFFKLSTSFYVSALAIAQVFNLSDYRSLVSAMSIILVVLSMITVPNSSYFQKLLTEIWPPYTMFMGIVLPLFLLIIAKFRGKSSPSSGN